MKSLLTIALVVALSVATFAKSHTFTACTQDRRQATLNIGLVDEASEAVIKNVQAAFNAAATALDAATLISGEGFTLFASNLSDEAKQAVEELHQPTIGGACADQK